MLTVQTTQEYFNMTTEQLAEVRKENGLYSTKEDNKILDEGLKVEFFDHFHTIINLQEEMQSYLKVSRMELKAILKTIDNRYAVIFN